MTQILKKSPGISSAEVGYEARRLSGPSRVCVTLKNCVIRILTNALTARNSFLLTNFSEASPKRPLSSVGDRQSQRPAGRRRYYHKHLFVSRCECLQDYAIRLLADAITPLPAAYTCWPLRKRIKLGESLYQRESSPVVVSIKFIGHCRVPF